jgi:aryl-alcohol dehydrogenase-like predicted oxidoreductase
VIGRALKGRRDKVVLASKFGQTQNPGGPNGVNGKPRLRDRRPARPA